MEENREGELRPTVLIVGGVAFALHDRAGGGFRGQRLDEEGGIAFDESLDGCAIGGGDVDQHETV